MKITIKIIVYSIALISMTLLFEWMYLMSPTFDEGKVRAARIVLRTHPRTFVKELRSNYYPLRLAISSFYLREKHLPTSDELKHTLTRTSLGDEGLLWERYGTNRLGKETYYHYGYEDGECTFFVDHLYKPEGFDRHFQENVLPLISHTFTELEHHWILEVNLSEPAPEILVLEPAVSSSVCLELLESLQWRQPERYKEIRNELLHEIEDGTYEKICVFSKQFQEKLATRKQESQDMGQTNNSAKQLSFSK